MKTETVSVLEILLRFHRLTGDILLDLGANSEEKAMPRQQYTFSVLRYIHNVVVGEYANVGVVLYAPGRRFLSCRCLDDWTRVSVFFGGIDCLWLQSVVCDLAIGIERLAGRLLEGGDFPECDVREWTDKLLPADSSSLQFGPSMGGVTEDLEKRLNHLYREFVARYTKGGGDANYR